MCACVLKGASSMGAACRTHRVRRVGLTQHAPVISRPILPEHLTFDLGADGHEIDTAQVLRHSTPYVTNESNLSPASPSTLNYFDLKHHNCLIIWCDALQYSCRCRLSTLETWPQHDFARSMASASNEYVHVPLPCLGNVSSQSSPPAPRGALRF
jgi:hypothetical protein